MKREKNNLTQNADEEKKKIFALFILFIPTIIIAIVPSDNYNLILVCVKILLAFYQLIVLKNFIDVHYGTNY